MREAAEAMTMTTTKSGVFVVAFLLEGGANEGARAQVVPKTAKVFNVLPETVKECVIMIAFSFAISIMSP